MDTTAGTRGGDRARAAFRDIVPTAASSDAPRRGSRLARAAPPTERDGVAPEAGPAAAPRRTSWPTPTPLAPEAGPPQTAPRAEAQAPKSAPGGLFSFAGSSTRRLAIVAAVALLLAVPVARQLGRFVANEAPSDHAAATPEATAPVLSAPVAPPRPLAAAALAAAPAVGTAPATADQPRTKRRSDSVIDVASGDTRMAAARDRARAGLATFWRHAEAPLAGESDFALKVALATRTGSLEHIWSVVESRNGDTLVVRISNDPVDIANVRLGSVVTVREAQISDWMFRRNGRMIGAESLRVLIETMPPAEAARYRAMLAP